MRASSRESPGCCSAWARFILFNNARLAASPSRLAKANFSLANKSGTGRALAALMTVCLLSLGGLPPTAGFVSKWYIFSAAVRSGHYDLAIVGMLSSVVSVFFYLRVVVMMYMADATESQPRPAIGAVPFLALVASMIALFYLGILPTRVLDLAASSVSTIF